MPASWLRPSGPDYIIPAPFDPRLISAVPAAVAKAAMGFRRRAQADRERHGRLPPRLAQPARPRPPPGSS